MTISLALLSTEVLASQDGHKGRPRKSGRVTCLVREGAPKTIELRKALAERYSVALASVTHYPRESDLAGTQVFVVAGIDKDTRHVLDCVDRPESAPEASPAS